MALDLSPQLTAHRPRKANGKVSDLALPSSSLNVAMSQPASAPPRPAPRAWTVQDKIEYFRQLPPILCPASPPPLEHPLMTEDEALSRSRARVERMTKRLASLPLYQARHLINLASTQLKGPFSPGCKYWGMTPPVASGPTNNDNSDPANNLINYRQSQCRPADFPRNPPEHSVRPPVAPGPSSTAVSGLASPATPPPIFPVDVSLVPAKSSVTRPLVPVDYDPPSPARSPTPTPSMPPPSRMASQAISETRPPETPMSASRQSFIHTLQQPSAHTSASQFRRPAKPLSPRSLNRFPTTSQRELKNSTSMRRPGSRESSTSRGSSPLIRFSQREPSQIARGSLRGSQIPPRFSQDITLSQRESSGEDYNSQFSFDRRFRDIARFMEDDIAG